MSRSKTKKERDAYNAELDEDLAGLAGYLDVVHDLATTYFVGHGCDEEGRVRPRWRGPSGPREFFRDWDKWSNHIMTDFEAVKSAKEFLEKLAEKYNVSTSTILAQVVAPARHIDWLITWDSA